MSCVQLRSDMQSRHTDNRHNRLNRVSESRDSNTQRAAPELRLNRVIELLQEQSSLRERQVFVLRKLVRAGQRGFLLKDLADVQKILNLCAEKLNLHQEFEQILCDLLQICGRPFLKEKSSDEESFAAAAADCVSHLGLLMRLPVPELRLQICSSILSLHSADTHTHSAAADGVCAVRVSYRRQLLERSAVAETLLMSLCVVEKQTLVKLRILQTLQTLSRTSAVNCAVMLRAAAVQTVCVRMCERDPSGQLLFRCSEILWNLLENGGAAAVAEQLCNTHCITALKEAFLHLLLHGFRRHDRQLRNDLLLLLSLSARFPAPLTESGVVKILALFATFPELKSHNPLVRNLKLSFSEEDFEMKKLLLNLLVLLSGDLAALQLFKDARVMLSLLLLMKPPLHAESRCSWSRSQQEELQLQALSTLSTLAPLMLEEYLSCHGNTCLLLLLHDTCSGRGHSLHGSGGRGSQKAQVRWCVRVLRAVAAVQHQTLLQDLCDQGCIGQLLGVLRWCRQEQDDGVCLEIQMDCLFILCVLCDGDVHRKELFGTEGVQLLLQVLSLDSSLLCSGLGHNRLLLSALDCVWSCVVGCFGTEDVFVAQRGVDLLLELLQRCPKHMLSVVMATLLELCENPLAVTHTLRWRGDGDTSATQLLLHIWRTEEDTHTHSSSTALQQPISSQHPSSSSHDCGAAVREVSETLHANIYCLLCKLGWALSALGADDLSTLCSVQRYLDLKVWQVLREVSAELLCSGVCVSADAAALERLLQAGEDAAASVRSQQQCIMGRQQAEEQQEEQRLYTQISFTHKQRQIATDAWKSFLARTSDRCALQEFRRRQEQWSSSGADAGQ